MELGSFIRAGVVPDFTMPAGGVAKVVECPVPNRFSEHDGVTAYVVTATTDAHFNACLVDKLTTGHVQDVVAEAVRNFISALGFKTGAHAEVVFMNVEMAIRAEKGWRRHAVLKNLFADWLRKAGLVEVEYSISARRVNQLKSNMPLELSAIVVVRLAGSRVQG